MSKWFGEIGDTFFDTFHSGHKGDEIDIIGGSFFDRGLDDPLEDEIPVYDPSNGDWLGYTNTADLPVGGDDKDDSRNANRPATGLNLKLIVYAVVGIVILYLIRPIFEAIAGVTEE